MASWNEEGYNGGGFLPGGPSPSGSLDQRKRQLLQWLAQRGATQAGYQGRAGSAVGRMGGIGGRGPLPSMTYNPFLAQIAGRSENFPYLPGGVSSAAANAVQSGGAGPGMGMAPDTPAHPMGANPGMDPAPGIVQPPGGNAGRNLIGVGSPPVGAPALQPGPTSILPQSFDPYLRLASIQGRGTFRS